MTAPRPDAARWSLAARAMFATYIDTRARHQPLECNGGDVCWVQLGPPAMSARGRCTGCNGFPKAPLKPYRTGRCRWQAPL